MTNPPNPASSGRCNVVLGEKDNELLIKLQYKLCLKLGNKRVSYSTVMRLALRKLAESEGVNHG